MIRRPSAVQVYSLLTSYSLPKGQSHITHFTAPLPSSDLHDSWGHSLDVVDPSSTFRIFLQNPIGLNLFSHNVSLQKDFQVCKDYGAAVLALPETKTNWGVPGQVNRLHSLLQHNWHNYVFHHFKSLEAFTSGRQPGRTATIVCRCWASRLVQKGNDPLGLGRWSFITLRGKGSCLVTNVTAYNPSYSLGDTSSYQQHTCLLTYLHSRHKQ
jgi:hypothetical protein